MPPAKPRTAHLVASPDDVEAQFYDALREGDIDKLMATWSDDDEIVCVHPGGPRVVGARAIRASFEAFFANGGVPVEIDNVRRVRSLDAAIHNLVESVLVTSPEGAERASIIATNVYVKTAQGWRLVAHHASPGEATEATEATDNPDAPSTLH